MTRKRSLAGPAGAVIALALVLAGCGGQPFPRAETPVSGVPTTVARPATPQARLLAAVQRATSARTARFAMNMTLTGYAEDDGDGTISAAGVIDMARERMQMTLSASAATGGESVEMRVVNGMIYVKDGTTWQSGSLLGADLQSPNPTSYLDYLEGIAPDVRVEGHDVLRGDDATRYGGTVDLAQALKRTATALGQAQLRHVFEQLGALKIPVTVWVDGLGRLRKITLAMDLGAVARSVGNAVDPKISVTMELYDFGVAVNVVAPAGAKNVEQVAQDRAAESDLRNALTAEKTIYTDNRQYNADATVMKQIEPSLDWGGKLTFVVGPSDFGPNGTVCLSERSASGTTFLIADVAEGAGAGTVYGKVACPATVTQGSVATFGSSW